MCACVHVDGPGFGRGETSAERVRRRVHREVQQERGAQRGAQRGTQRGAQRGVQHRHEDAPLVEVLLAGEALPVLAGDAVDGLGEVDERHWLEVRLGFGLESVLGLGLGLELGLGLGLGSGFRGQGLGLGLGLGISRPGQGESGRKERVWRGGGPRMGEVAAVGTVLLCAAVRGGRRLCAVLL